jgi:hypothetical protein
LRVVALGITAVAYNAAGDLLYESEVIWLRLPLTEMVRPLGLQPVLVLVPDLRQVTNVLHWKHRSFRLNNWNKTVLSSHNLPGSDGAGASRTSASGNESLELGHVRTECNTY